jgi:hypothetical protein
MTSLAVVTSADGNVSFASHFSNVPSSATEAFTENLIALSSGTTWNTVFPVKGHRARYSW